MYHQERLKTFAKQSVELELQKAHLERKKELGTLSATGVSLLHDTAVSLDYIDSVLDEAKELAHEELLDMTKTIGQLSKEMALDIQEAVDAEEDRRERDEKFLRSSMDPRQRERDEQDGLEQDRR